MIAAADGTAAALAAISISARHAGATSAAKLVIPHAVRMVLAYRSEAKAADPFHSIRRAQRRSLVLVQKLLLRKPPELFISALGLASLLPKLVGRDLPLCAVLQTA